MQDEHSARRITEVSIHGGINWKVGVQPTCVTKIEVLVGELFPIDAHPSSPVPLYKVSPLKHEILDDSMEGRPLVSRWYALRYQ